MSISIDGLVAVRAERDEMSSDVRRLRAPWLAALRDPSG